MKRQTKTDILILILAALGPLVIGCLIIFN